MAEASIAAGLIERYGVTMEQVEFLDELLLGLCGGSHESATAERISTFNYDPEQCRWGLVETGELSNSVAVELLDADEFATYSTMTESFTSRGRQWDPHVYDVVRLMVMVAIIMGHEAQAREIANSSIFDQLYAEGQDEEVVLSEIIHNLGKYLEEGLDMPLIWWVKLTPGMFWFYDED